MNNEMSSLQSILFDLIQSGQTITVVFNERDRIEVNRFIKTFGTDVVQLAYDSGVENSSRMYFVNTKQINYLM